MRPVTSMPAVTAGFTCAPEMPPKLCTAIESASPCASAIATSPPAPPTDPVVHKMAAMPAKHR